MGSASSVIQVNILINQLLYTQLLDLYSIEPKKKKNVIITDEFRKDKLKIKGQWPAGKLFF